MLRRIARVLRSDVNAPFIAYPLSMLVGIKQAVLLLVTGDLGKMGWSLPLAFGVATFAAFLEGVRKGAVGWLAAGVVGLVALIPSLAWYVLVSGSG